MDQFWISEAECEQIASDNMSGCLHGMGVLAHLRKLGPLPELGTSFGGSLYQIIFSTKYNKGNAVSFFCADFKVEILIQDNDDTDTIETDEEIVQGLLTEIINTVAGVKEEEEEGPLDPAEARAKYCHKFVEDIRREQFGVGLKFGVEEEKLINILRERQVMKLVKIHKHCDMLCKRNPSSHNMWKLICLPLSLLPSLSHPLICLFSHIP